MRFISKVLIPTSIITIFSCVVIAGPRNNMPQSIARNFLDTVVIVSTIAGSIYTYLSYHRSNRLFPRSTIKYIYILSGIMVVLAPGSILLLIFSLSTAPEVTSVSKISATPHSTVVPLPTLIPTNLSQGDYPSSAPYQFPPAPVNTSTLVQPSMCGICGTGIVISDAPLRIRREPNLSGQIIGHVAKGGVVDILCGIPIEAEEHIWLRVHFGNVEGYMSSYFLQR